MPWLSTQVLTALPIADDPLLTPVAEQCSGDIAERTAKGIRRRTTPLARTPDCAYSLGHRIRHADAMSATLRAIVDEITTRLSAQRTDLLRRTARVGRIR